MRNPLIQFRNIPVTAAMVASVYHGISQTGHKVANLEAKNEIIRLKRGFYVVNPEITGKKLSLELIANHLCSPSYVSMYTALRYYGLIPERVSVVQSMTTLRKRSFSNSLGTFEYIHTDNKNFHVGITHEEHDGIFFLIATPERALCDLIAEMKNINLRFLTEVEPFLEDDLRLDMDWLRSSRIEIFEEYAENGKKGNSIRTILNWIRNERDI